jgi:chromosome segregation ATPase
MNWRKNMSVDIDKIRIDVNALSSVVLTYEEWPQNDQDMRDIADAAWDLPDALEEIDRLRAENNQLQEELTKKGITIDSMSEQLEKDADRIAELESDNDMTANRDSAEVRIKDLDFLNKNLNSIRIKTQKAEESMTEEKLKRFRDYANHYQGSDVYFLIEYIDRLTFDLDLKRAQHVNQAHVIESYLGMLTDFNEIIEWQTKQITTLKTTLIGVVSDQYDSDETKSAKMKAVEQLVKEYPKIFADEDKLL